MTTGKKKRPASNYNIYKRRPKTTPQIILTKDELRAVAEFAVVAFKKKGGKVRTVPMHTSSLTE